ncbi:hypothetical protein EJB05_49643, partial [Eragrostis curvula]
MVGCPDQFLVTERGGDDGLDTSANKPCMRCALKFRAMVMHEDYYMDDLMDTFNLAERGREDGYRNWCWFDYSLVYVSKSFNSQPAYGSTPDTEPKGKSAYTEDQLYGFS